MTDLPERRPVVAPTDVPEPASCNGRDSSTPTAVPVEEEPDEKDEWLWDDDEAHATDPGGASRTRNGGNNDKDEYPHKGPGLFKRAAKRHGWAPLGISATAFAVMAAFLAYVVIIWPSDLMVSGPNVAEVETNTAEPEAAAVEATDEVAEPPIEPAAEPEPEPVEVASVPPEPERTDPQPAAAPEPEPKPEPAKEAKAPAPEPEVAKEEQVAEAPAEEPPAEPAVAAANCNGVRFPRTNVAYVVVQGGAMWRVPGIKRASDGSCVFARDGTAVPADCFSSSPPKSGCPRSEVFIKGT